MGLDQASLGAQRCDRRASPSEPAKAASFVAVRVAAPVATTTVCRIRHPSDWTIECASYPEASWILALMSGEAA
jgi:hypothetical protein